MTTPAPPAAAADRIVARPSALALTPERAAMVIVVLLWLRWTANYVLNSLLGEKYFVPIGEVAETHPVAEAAGRAFFLLLLGFCAAVVLFRMRDVTRVGLLRLAVFLAPWAYIVMRDAYDGVLRAEALPYALIVLALAALRPGRTTLACIGVLIGITAVLCLLFGVLLPEAGIMRGSDMEYRQAAKSLFPSLGLLQGVFTSENNMAQFLALGSPFVLLVRNRWLARGLVAAIVVAVLWSSSRSGMTVLAVVLATALVCSVLQHRALHHAVALFLATATVTMAAVMVWLPVQQWPDDAFTTRGDIWRGTRDAWLGHADWFGLGSEWFERIASTATSPFNGGAYHAHNQFLHAGATGGVVFVFLLGLWLTALVAVTVRAGQRLYVTAGLVLVALPVAGALEVPLGFTDRSQFWLVTVVPLAVLFFAPLTATPSPSPGQAAPHPTGAASLPARTQHRLGVVLAAGLVCVTAVACLGYAGLTGSLTQRGLFRDAPPVAVASDPFSALPLHVDPSSQTVQASRQDPRFEAIARVPQAKWFTDWSTGETVEADVATYLSGALAQRTLPVLVLYRIPGRDCGSHAAGGAASPASYRQWIDGAARAMAGHEAIVIVEPDALAQADRCGEERLDLLRYATEQMAAAGAWVYLDAGHSDWVPPREMAERLREAGVASARGFATNVANHHSTAEEQEYADQVVAELAALGVEDRHYVIDTSRNGGEVADGDRCNAPGARLGQEPEMVYDGALDGLLWVKNPAESDGACNGGPRTGFWSQLALMLLGLDNSIER